MFNSTKSFFNFFTTLFFYNKMNELNNNMNEEEKQWKCIHHSQINKKHFSGNGNASFTYNGQIACSLATNMQPYYYDVAYLHPVIANQYTSPYYVPGETNSISFFSFPFLKNSNKLTQTNKLKQTVTGGPDYFHVLPGSTYAIQLGKPISWNSKSGSVFGGYPFINTWTTPNNFVVTGSIWFSFGDMF